ncbi:MAG: nitroreductase [Ruminococcaceae bacterium]|nr:nitroreductase [Oscillospiraceae bacterium]
MELTRAIEERRSIRKYAPCVVKKEEIEELVASAQLAPSWKNSQTARFYVALSDEIKEKVRGSLASFNYERTENAGAFIVTTVVHGISGYTAQGETHLGNGFECFDNGLAVENLLLKATEMGYGTLIMGLYKEDKIRELFGIPDEENVVVVIALGKADIEPEMPQRKEIEGILKIF